MSVAYPNVHANSTPAPYVAVRLRQQARELPYEQENVLTESLIQTIETAIRQVLKRLPGYKIDIVYRVSFDAFKIDLGNNKDWFASQMFTRELVEKSINITEALHYSMQALIRKFEPAPAA